MPKNLSKKYVRYNQAYAVVIARTIDILCAGWLWRDYDVTISAHCGKEMQKARPKLWARVLNAFLNWCEKDHCTLAIICDLERAHQAIKFLSPRPPDP